MRKRRALPARDRQMDPERAAPTLKRALAGSPDPASTRELTGLDLTIQPEQWEQPEQ